MSPSRFSLILFLAFVLFCSLFLFLPVFQKEFSFFYYIAFFVF